MGAPDEVLQMLKRGLSPGAIRFARQQAGNGSSVNTIIPYIDSLIGAGQIRRSDVLVTIGIETRRTIEVAISRDPGASDEQVARSLSTPGDVIDSADVAAFRRYGDARFSLGDMYDDILKSETQLHVAVKGVLQSALLDQWWNVGVPPDVQKDCASRAPRELYGPELYGYTTIMNLHDVIRNQPSLFTGRLAAWNRPDLETLLQDLKRLNRIRRFVMHPVGGRRPTDEDFEFTKLLVTHPGVE